MLLDEVPRFTASMSLWPLSLHCALCWPQVFFVS